MKNKIFIESAMKEFDFLKNPTSVSARLASHIKISDLGYFMPLSNHYIENINFNKTIKDLSKITFLIYNNSDIFLGKLDLNLEERNEEFIVKIENFLVEEKHFKLLNDILNNLISWIYSVLFPEKIIFKIEKEQKSIIKLLNDINYNIILNEDLSSITLSLSIDQQIGKKMILTAGPSIGSREKVYALDAASHGWNNEWNKYLTKFENDFADYIGVKYALSTSSCTGALHISLMALGIGPGDEVIVPEITWVATANAVRFVGATPIFADIDRNTWTICPNSIEKLITSNTKAIIPVHLYGNPCEMDLITKIAKENNLFIVEDAAPSIGAEYKGKKTGTFGDFSAFSFQGAKLSVTGEGGMLCTNDKSLYERALRIWDQGRIPGTFWIEELGVKYKMSNIQAALGLGQLSRNNSMVEAKRRINVWYKERIGNHRDIDFWGEDTNSRCIFWMTNIRLNENSSISRDEFCKELKKYNIDTRPVFPAISQYPYWPKKQAPHKVANEIGSTAINLPSGVALTKGHVNYICDKIIEILKTH